MSKTTITDICEILGDDIKNPEMREIFDLQVKVCERAEREIFKGKTSGRMSLIMDLDSVPGLDLKALLEAPAFDFAHDICGILRHMDRSSYPGKLTDCFVPRFSRGH